MNRTLANFLSVIGHPMLVLTYMLLILATVNPQQFGGTGIGDRRSILLLLSVFITSFLLPALAVLLMKPLGFITSLQMSDKQERIGPYIATGVFYLWLYKNLASVGQAPDLFQVCVLGATIGLFLAFFINIFTKISAHAVGMGGFATMILLALKRPEWAYYGLEIPCFGNVLQMSLLAVLAVVIVFAGLIGTARLALGAHVPADLYRGYVAGAAAVLLADMLL